MATVDRYLIREIGVAWLATTAILVAATTTMQYVRFLRDAASGDIPQQIVFRLLGLSAIQELRVVMPLALFLGVIMGYGRLARDHENFALAAAGIGPARLYRPLMVLALVGALILGVVSFWGSPWAVRETVAVKTEAQRTLRLSAVEPGRFNSVGEGDSVLYAGGASDGGRTLHDVFIHTKRDGASVILSAKRGELAPNTEPNVRVLLLYDGYRYRGEIGSAEFRKVAFRRHGLRYELPEVQAEGEGPSQVPTAALMGSNERADRAELHRRLGVSVSALALSFLALPLARAAPRRGRYTPVFLGIVIYIIYNNLMGAGRVWLGNGYLPMAAGLWWVHCVPVVAGFVLLARDHGWAWMVGWHRIPEAR